MKAAVLNNTGEIPQYGEFQMPVPQSTDQLLLRVLASALKNLDKSRAAGTHYSGYDQFPAVVGTDGAGVLEDGTKVYATTGITGMMGEYALISKKACTVVPDGLDMAIAAALPNAVIGAALALKFRAGMQPGQHVLINGATGFTGKAAVQIAKHYGAGHITATGRNEEVLQQLKSLGADTVIALNNTDDAITADLKNVLATQPVDIVLDYLWGRPIELIIQSLKGAGLQSIPRPVKIVTVGEMAGPAINLSSGVLRSAPVEICGSGFGSLPQSALAAFQLEILPEMFMLAAAGRLKVDIKTEPLSNVSAAWSHDVTGGERIVLTM